KRSLQSAANGRSFVLDPGPLVVCFVSSPAYFTAQPGASEAPFAFDSSVRNAEHGGGFFNGQAAEETHLDDAAVLRFDRRQILQGIIERQQVDIRLTAKAVGLAEREGIFFTLALSGSALARM